MLRATMDYVVLDALANDIEDVSSILRLANHPGVGWTRLVGGRIEETSVLATLLRLVTDQLVRVLVPSSEAPCLEPLPLGALAPVELVPHCYYEMTSAGREVHTAWTPPDVRD